MHFWSSSIGKKTLMALSGGALILFLIAHLLGNLAIFEGQEAVNAYAVFLRSVPKLLWTARIGLILAFVVHIVTSVQLTLENKAARPQGYAVVKRRSASLASQTMMWGGLVVLSFVIYHLAHLTFGVTDPVVAQLVDSKGRHDVYNMVVLGFQNPMISGFYILAQLFLGLHLSHGFASAAQTLGLTQTGAAKTLRRAGRLFAITLAVLYISIPVSVMMGWVHAA